MSRESEERNRTVLVSPDVSVLLNAGYPMRRGRLAEQLGITNAQLQKLESAARLFADALADALGMPVDLRCTDIPDWWGDGDFEPDATLGLPCGWDVDRWQRWCKERFKP